MNENITAVDRRRTGTKRATGVAFGALVGTALTILAPGLTSSASAAEVEGSGGPGYANFYNGSGTVAGTTDRTMLKTQLGSTAEGFAVARFWTGGVVVSADDSSSRSERVTTTYTLQKQTPGETAWKVVESKQVVTSIAGTEVKTIAPEKFTTLAYGGKVARYRLVAAFDWTEVSTGKHLSTKQLTSANDWDYKCGASWMYGRVPLNCAIGSVDNRFAINMS